MDDFNKYVELIMSMSLSVLTCDIDRETYLANLAMTNKQMDKFRKEVVTNA